MGDTAVRPKLWTIALALAAVISCSLLQPHPHPDTTPAIQPQPPTPLIGYIGRRGHLHRIEDILDPTYRAASNDPAIRDLHPAQMWCGL